MKIIRPRKGHSILLDIFLNHDVSKTKLKKGILTHLEHLLTPFQNIINIFFFTKPYFLIFYDWHNYAIISTNYSFVAVLFTPSKGPKRSANTHRETFKDCIKV